MIEGTGTYMCVSFQPHIVLLQIIVANLDCVIVQIYIKVFCIKVYRNIRMKFVLKYNLGIEV